MRLDEALKRWDRYSFTHALRAVDAARITAESLAAPHGPLRGLLFSVKDLFPVAGVESCAGSLLLRGSVPERDPALIAALRAAGAVVLGKGVCAEFGFGVDTENRLDGRVLHFADSSVSPGGSSGGDAIAVGAGIVDFAVAGDYGGSVRWPAQAARIFGLRLGLAHPMARARASGRIGLRPPDGQPASLQREAETAGLMARSPRVLRTVLAALAERPLEGAPRIRSESSWLAPAGGPHPAGHLYPGQAGRRQAPRKRLIVSDGTEIAPVMPEVSAALAAARGAAERAGYHVATAPDGLRDALRDALPVYAALRAATDDHAEVRQLAAGQEELLCGSTRAVLAQSERVRASPDPATVSRLRERAAQIGLAVRAALRSAAADALLMPTAASGPIGFGARVEVAGRVLDATDLMAHCRAVSLTGLPALSVPAGRLPQLMPARTGVSVQLVGADREEDLLCAVAADLTEAGPGRAGRDAPGGRGARP